MAQSSENHLERSKDAIARQNPKDHEKGLHELRKSVDALIQWTAQMKKDRESGYGREIALVHTKLQEAKMWAGKCIEQIGEPLPPQYADRAE